MHQEPIQLLLCYFHSKELLNNRIWEKWFVEVIFVEETAKGGLFLCVLFNSLIF